MHGRPPPHGRPVFEAASSRPPSISENPEIDAAAADGRSCRALSRPPYGKRCCPNHSPTLRPWIAGTEVRFRVRRGGVLEPGARTPSEKSIAKAVEHFQLSIFRCENAEGLSLSGGASVSVVCFSSWASSFRLAVLSLKRRRRPLGSPSLSRNALVCLARAPRCEGIHGIVPAGGVREPVLARPPGDRGRFGDRSRRKCRVHGSHHRYRSAG